MILIVSTCADPLSELEFVAPLRALCPKSKSVHYSKLSAADIVQATKIIISGTALMDFEYLKGNWDWIATCTKPVLGICAGLQVIAKAFNFALIDHTVIGVRQVRVRKSNLLLNQEVSAYFLHTKIVKGDFDVLAESDDFPCLIQIKGKPIFGCVFHPEILNEGIVSAFLSEKI